MVLCVTLCHAIVVIVGKVIGCAKNAIHHAECLKFVSLQSQAKMCSKCSLFCENVLRGRLSCHLKELNSEIQSTSAVSHTNFRYLVNMKG